MSETIETGYHRREREAMERVGEKGQILAELARPRSPGAQSSFVFLGLPAALAEWFAGIARRRAERKNDNG